MNITFLNPQVVMLDIVISVFKDGVYGIVQERFGKGRRRARPSLAELLLEDFEEGCTVMGHLRRGFT